MSAEEINGKPVNGKPLDEIIYEQGRVRRERMAELRAKRRENFESHKSGLSARQVRLAQNVSLGMPHFDAYRQAGYGTSLTTVNQASQAVCGMMAQPRMKAYLRELQESAYLANVLSLAEKRSFLADVVRTPVGKLTTEDKLAQRVRYHKGEMVELAMPDKIKALELDARLSGELKENNLSVNVGVALVNERLKTIGETLPKDA